MLTPNHIYLTTNNDKTKIYVKNLSESPSIKFMLNELTLKITNNNKNIIIELLDDNGEIQGIINYE